MTKAATTVERVSDCELVITRIVGGPRATVFRAWAEADLFRQWWLPQGFGMTMVSCTMDVRTGGSYRLVIAHPDAPEPMAFHGTYLDVVAPERIVWTNEEGGEAGQVTTVTFEDLGTTTRVVVCERFASAAALDEAIGNGSTSGWDAQLAQLEAMIAAAA